MALFVVQPIHYSDLMISAMASQITGVSSVYLTIYSGTDQRKHQKLHFAGLCEGSSPVTCEFPAPRASNAPRASSADNVSIWWRHLGQARFLLKAIVQSFSNVWFRCIMMTSSNGNICRLRYWPFVRRIHRSRWIPHTRASDAELWCLLWSAPE